MILQANNRSKKICNTKQNKQEACLKLFTVDMQVLNHYIILQAESFDGTYKIPFSRRGAETRGGYIPPII